ncbi:hypothetical protein F4678DRAFT_463266 [Xylaria arbuscula]|nr:hypothetical protein F4678DRAFT_463266 [Xylaria arbuscula]
MGSAGTADDDLQKELLDLSAISDVTVQCGEKTWNLHSAILARRSRWFKAVLLGGSKEANTRTIRIEEFDEESPWTGRNCKGNRHSLVSVLFIRPPPPEAYEKDGYVQPNHADVFGIIGEVYLDAGGSAATKTLREILVAAMYSVRYVINGAAFIALMEEVPAFATDMMIIIWARREPVGHECYARRCSGCKKKVKELAELGVGYSTVIVRGECAVGTCYSCDPACQKYGPWETSKVREDPWCVY